MERYMADYKTKIGAALRYAEEFQNTDDFNYEVDPEEVTEETFRILDGLHISHIEQYLRKKKLDQLNERQQ